MSGSDPTTPRAQRRSRMFDIGLVILLGVGGLLEIFLGPPAEGSHRDPDLVEAVLTVSVVLPLLWRRRWPIQAMVISGVFYFAWVFVGYLTSSGTDSAQLIAVYSVGAFGPRPAATVARWATGVAIAAAVLWAHELGEVTYTQFVLMMTTWTGAAFLGETMYVRRRYQASLEERARLAEAERDERARLAVQDERARISRELHDVWAHTLALVVVQAGAAEEVLDESPEEARRALIRIQEAGRQALAEIRRLIGSDAAISAASRTPAPRLIDIRRLVDDLGEAGMAVELSITGPIDALPADVGLSAYRIVQQALTNTLTHGGPGATASVDVRWAEGELVIDVSDDGLGAASPRDLDHQGRGLIGMRERVAVFGGDLEAGPRPEGGFRVHARIPMEASA